MLSLYTDRLIERRQKNLYRSRNITNNSSVSFSSNNYLGLANHPKIVMAFKNAAEKYGIGSGASPLLGGYHTAHRNLEESIAAFTGYPRALIFSTAYMANLGTIATLLGKNDFILQDKLNHASLIDAGKLSGANLKRYLHCNINSLKQNLILTENKNKLIISDGVFSMDGDIAPLKNLIAIAKNFHTTLLIDDSHGVGVLGKNGGGICEHTQEKPNILIGSFGKAFGTFGAFVASSEIIIENLIQFARSYIYTTALPPALAEATYTSLHLLQEENWRREKLIHLINYFKKNAETLDLKLLPSLTPIQPILINDTNHLMRLHQKLHEHGIVVGAIRTPTVAPNKARLRITLNVEHTEQQIDYLLCCLQNFIAKH